MFIRTNEITDAANIANVLDKWNTASLRRNKGRQTIVLNCRLVYLPSRRRTNKFAVHLCIEMIGISSIIAASCGSIQRMEIAIDPRLARVFLERYGIQRRSVSSDELEPGSPSYGRQPSSSLDEELAISTAHVP